MTAPFQDRIPMTPTQRQLRTRHRFPTDAMLPRDAEVMVTILRSFAEHQRPPAWYEYPLPRQTVHAALRRLRAVGLITFDSSKSGTVRPTVAVVIPRNMPKRRRTRKSRMVR